METEPCDQALILERARQGEEAAWRTLVEHLYPTVIRIVRSHLPVRQTEEDLAQEVFVNIFSRLDRYQARPGIPMTHWVSRVAVTTCLDALRAERRRPELRWADLSEDQAAWLEYMATDSVASPQTSSQEAREIIEKLLSQLTAADRMILNLLHLEERTVQEISQMTGWSVPSVKVRAYRARCRLRQAALNLKSTAPYEEF